MRDINLRRWAVEPAEKRGTRPADTYSVVAEGSPDEEVSLELSNVTWEFAKAVVDKHNALLPKIVYTVTFEGLPSDMLDDLMTWAALTWGNIVNTTIEADKAVR